MTTVEVAKTHELSIAPIAGYLGAEVSGIDLREGISAETAERLRSALYRFRVLFFRDQPIDHAQQIAFTRIFGPVTPAHPHRYTDKSPEGFPEILEVDSRIYAKRFGTPQYSYASFWHQDVTALINPPAVTALRAEIVPAVGGDTTWTDLVAAYANLPESLKAFLDGLYAENRFGGRAPKWAEGSESDGLVKQTPIISEHPVVRLHPITGERILHVNPGFTSRIVGLSPRQSDRVLDLLFEEITNPAYTVRIRWTPDSLGIWDNRAVAHLAPTDLDHLDVVRVLHRTTVEGEIPVGVDGKPSRPVSGEPFYSDETLANRP
ncbi:TauD/TfdA dioxygenase family protein [Nocardia bovistercoris]|uniref:TauD/TfdA family dioxygenase n=1 Tax=Nocardia bovistercoris TaxID=2785916 RepID=A0A931I7B3_9NOCA|nr:TauD/TfdA family dioxygenase [Nocardia bovistercoris]MBH0776262.1 TauD/TfdA family dioxygenase [Nocardia bovistercoris]